jgi:hypothetical protein
MSKPISTVMLLRDALIVATVAVLTVQGLRRWYGDRYLVPSDSMQPVLYGDPVDGDVVFVYKLAKASSCQRGDYVVVEHPLRPGHQLVKRIAASGDEKGKTCIDIRKGDVWLGDSPQQMRREVKDPKHAMPRSVTWAVAGGGSEAVEGLDMRAVTGDGPWLLPPAESSLANVRSAFRRRAHMARHQNTDDGILPPGFIGTSAPVNATFLDVTGRRSLTGDRMSVTDCGMEAEFSNRPAVVMASIDSTDFATTFVWNAKGNTLSVWLDGRTIHTAANVLAGEWQGKITFGRLDGRDFVMIDDDFTLPLQIPGKGMSPLPRTWLHVGVIGAAPASLSSVRVFRDVYSTRLEELSVGESRWPIRIEPGHWFLLGDNSFDSRDSRHIGAVATSAFLGVPTRVIGPWSRARVLTP